MMGNSFVLIILTAISYYFFSDRFFRFTSEIKKVKMSNKAHFVCFFIVYVWFLAASYMELPLVVNWFIFLIILGLEVHILFSFDFMVSYSLSLFCIILGLAVNVLFRGLASILLNVPLKAFDNDLMTTLKSYPIFLGFIVMGLLFYCLLRIHFPSKLERMLYYRKSLVFYTWTEVFIYLFLMLQLLAFTQSGNETGIKLWGIKSALFSAIVLVITIIYALRVAALHYYMDRQHEVREQLIMEKQDINKLWKLAYTDILTGLNNRQMLDKRLEEYSGYGSHITLAFIDVNGLKITNDQYGHIEGDRYLIDVARILTRICDGNNVDLYRYGGDEFVAMSNTLREEDMWKLLGEVNEQLKSGQTPYSRSISFGVVHGDCLEHRKLITAADDMMYRHKMDHYESMARS